MSNARFKALEMVQDRKPLLVSMPSAKVSEYFGSNTFSFETMRTMLSEDSYDRFMLAVKKGERLDETVADAVASAMKGWAISKGVTHYTHWFQPLTGTTAEKHDSFFQLKPSGKAIEEFKGSTLVQQEPDASSFPNGGLRNTFEARGYTAWDPSSPAFIIESGEGKTLCIPTIFVSYTGEALDHKAPLLKSLEIIDKAATAVCQYFDKDVTHVFATLGVEQEFFLVDKAMHDARPDLVACGRTVFGSRPPKGQQLEDHYFGSIPVRVQRFLQDLEIEAYKLGIPIKTRHNEVAPSQFEIAPSFEEVNVAVDHNQLLMDIMGRTADKHNFKVLLHEKPFAGVNGSGKHNNWSIATDNGQNLLQPSSKAKVNLQFLTFFVNIIKAVDEHSALLRASIAGAGNDYRLGANEAPPAIMSVFIGAQMYSVIEELEQNANVKVGKGDNVYMKLGIDKIPAILLDNTDRNRTSPFAFTGNKFEFRAVGSSANSAGPMTALNLIVADQLNKFKKEVDKLIDAGTKRELAIVNVLRSYIKSSKKVVFEGNGYGDEWVQEAAKRGLPNVKNTPEALDAYVSEKTSKLMTKYNVMSEAELHARHHIMLESYVRRVQIESRVMSELALNTIAPAALKYQSTLIDNVKGLMEIGLESETGEVKETVRRLSQYINGMTRLTYDMIEARKKANDIEDVRAQAVAYKDLREKYFDAIRENGDKLERRVDDAAWPLPKYREILFLR